MDKILENMTDDGYKLLKAILENPGSTPARFWFSEPAVDGYVQIFEKSGYINISSEGNLYITELGRVALKEYDVNKKKLLYKAAKELESQNSKQQDDKINQEATLKESRFNRRTTIISIVVAVLTLLVAVLTLLATIPS